MGLFFDKLYILRQLLIFSYGLRAQICTIYLAIYFKKSLMKKNFSVKIYRQK